MEVSTRSSGLEAAVARDKAFAARIALIQSLVRSWRRTAKPEQLQEGPESLWIQHLRAWAITATTAYPWSSWTIAPGDTFTFKCGLAGTAIYGAVDTFAQINHVDTSFSNEFLKKTNNERLFLKFLVINWIFVSSAILSIMLSSRNDVCKTWYQGSLC